VARAYDALVLRTLARILLACIAAALVGTGAPGLRALHLVTDAGHAFMGRAAEAADHHGCGHHHHDRHDVSHDRHDESDDRHDESDDRHDESDDRHDESDDRHDDLGCATCELLLALATVIPSTPEVPAYLALVAVSDEAAPRACPAPPALRALSARPPPAC